MKKHKQIYYIEHLTVITWLTAIFAYLFSESRNIKQQQQVYYIDGTKLGIMLAGLMSGLVKARIERLDFKLIDIRDGSGNLVRLRIAYQDMAEVLKEIIANPIYQGFLNEVKDINRLPVFLKKQLTTIDLGGNDQMFRVLFLVQIAAWQTARTSGDQTESVLFLNKRLWRAEIINYALKNRVAIRWVRKNRVSLKEILLKVFGARLYVLMDLYYTFRTKHGLKKLLGRLFSANKIITRSADNSGHSPRLAVEYYGHLNLKRPELHSDLFFSQQSSMKPEDVLVLFGINLDPLDENKWKEVTGCGMSAIALTRRAAAYENAPYFSYRPRKKAGVQQIQISGRSKETGYLKQLIKTYYRKKDYWTQFFTDNDVKLFISWYKYDASHCVIADALQSTGGITTLYQRAYEEFPSPETTTAVDVMFGFSAEGAELEKQSGSIIPYHVTAGYIGDHRYPLVKQTAAELRRSLREHGAKRIIAFFDENSGNDSRWHTGHEFMRVNYRFLLEKAINDPEIGLIFKPKQPATLRGRLGPVALLLEQVEKTGRCFVFEGGLLSGAYPPAAAALASDITIHGHLCAATAGVESALAGAPTLLLDREGWNISRLYRLGKDKVVFNNWADLWTALNENWNTESGIPGFGDWGDVLNDLDPFRDGRAAERIGEYLNWLLEGFKAGLPRETVMADAAERYGKIWGADKIIRIN
ncbi:MAG: hypothetical protein ABIH39_05845 [Candidatus Margulisiibacteriota bacterium]